MTDADLHRELKRLERRKAMLEKALRLKQQVAELEKGQLNGNDRAIAKLIADEVGKGFGLDYSAMCSRSRRKSISKPRQLVFYLCHTLTGLSSNQIGELFFRDHGTVLHGESCTEDRLATDKQFAATVKDLKATCLNRLREAGLNPQGLWWVNE